MRGNRWRPASSVHRILLHEMTQEKPVMVKKSRSRSLETRDVRRPSMDRRWTPAIAERILDIIGKTGSPKMASKATGVSVATIHDHRKRDLEFGTRYGEAMDAAFHNVLGRAFERSLDDEEPSDRLIEVLLKFRWPERLNGFLAVVGDGPADTSGPVALDPRVIAKMVPADRVALICLLEKYLDVEQRNGQQAIVIEG